MIPEDFKHQKKILSKTSEGETSIYLRDKTPEKRS